VRTALYAVASGDVDDIALGRWSCRSTDRLVWPAGISCASARRGRDARTRGTGRRPGHRSTASAGRGPVPDTAPGERVKLSRFRLLRVADGVLLVSAPTSHCAVELYTTTLLGELTDWTRTGDLSAESAAD